MESLKKYDEPEKLIPLHCGYRKLKSFQVAQLVYDVTARFWSVRTCPRFQSDDMSPHSTAPEARHICRIQSQSKFSSVRSGIFRSS
jgi:hypothetical protein